MNKKIKYLKHLLEKRDNYFEFSIRLLEAFDIYHKDDKLDNLKKLFGDYFNENDRIFDFMTQIELNFIENLKGDQKIILSQALEQSFAAYSLDKNDKNTFLSLLSLMIYGEFYNCVKYIKNVWKDLERKGFDDKENRVFAIKILRYIAAIKNINIANEFANMVLYNKNFHINFAPLILMIKLKNNPNILPDLLHIFTEMDWKEKKDDTFFIRLSKSLLREVGLQSLAVTFTELEPNLLWFVEYLFKTEKITIRANSTITEWELAYKNEFYRIIENNIKYEEFEKLLLDYPFVKYVFVNVDKYKSKDEYDYSDASIRLDEIMGKNHLKQDKKTLAIATSERQI